MLGDISKVEGIYLACGYTDLRRGIDGLAQIVERQFHLEPCSNKLFLFCGRRCDRIKALLWEGDGFVLLYKRVENGGGFQWPRSRQELRQLNWQEFRWLFEGLSVDQPKANKAVSRVQLQAQVFNKKQWRFCSTLPNIFPHNSHTKWLVKRAIFLYNRSRNDTDGGRQNGKNVESWNCGAFGKAALYERRKGRLHPRASKQSERPCR